MADYPVLNDLSFYTNRTSGGVDQTEVNSERGQAFLAALRQYDPGAYFKPVEHGGYVTGYDLTFDAGKLPNYDPRAITTTGMGYNDRPMQWSDSLKDPNAVTQSDLYGTQTQRSNLDMNDPMWWWGPAAVLGSVFAFPALASAMSGGALGGGAAAAGASAPLDTGSDFYLGMGQGFPEPYAAVPSSGGGLLGNAPLGSAESSLYGTGVQTAPETALGGGAGTQAAAPIVDRSTNAGLWDQLRLNPLGALNNPNVLSALGRAAGGLLGGGLGTGGGLGGGSLNVGGGGGGGAAGDITEMLRRFYGLDQLAMAKALREAKTRGMANG